MLIPLLLLAATEIGLRLAGYGYSTGFFRTATIGGESVLVENDKFGLRFFPAALARTPAPVVLRPAKPPGTIRIFVLGESAALGDPRPAYGFGRYLEVLLRERHPQARFEVVNVAMTAINSHAILPIARECARYDGDFWLVYMGNNEFVGPFGANTVFGPQAPSAGAVRARLALQSTRVGQALNTLGNHLRGRESAATNWTGLKLFLGNELAPNDPRREQVYANFTRNLEDLVRAGTRSGARVIVASVASNLKDCPPFASWAGTNLPAADRQEWTQLLATAKLVQASGHLADALPVLRAVVAEDPAFAEGHYRLAQSELASGKAREARRHFELARDTDALPFRADTRLNQIAGEIVRQAAHPRLTWLDAAAAIAAGSPDGLPGEESFHEHVHLTFDGNYRLALAIAAQVEAGLPENLTREAAPDWTSQAICEERLALSDWNRYGVLESMIQRLLDAPYTNQLNHLPRLRSAWSRLQEVKSRLTPSARFEAVPLYEDAIRRTPADHRLHENYAEFLEATGELAKATAEWQRVRELLPHHFLGGYHAGRLLARQKKYPEAREALNQALALRPDLTEAHAELGSILAAEGKPEEALRRYDEALRLRPESGARLQLERADALVRLNRREEAIEALREAIRLRPTYWEARYLLGVEMAVDGKLDEAESQFAEVVRLRPDHLLGHLNLGIALARRQRFEDALVEFNEVLRLDPLNQKALQAVETIKSFQSDSVPPLLRP
ncbi:MAG: tetratricopeptide repeat protein [Limisphaerales bacterium]